MFKKRRKGQAIVELSLVFPFFLLIIIGGIIDFGFAFYNYLTLQQLANDTAQYAADKNASDSQINAFVNSSKLYGQLAKWNGDFTIYTPERVALQTIGTVVKIKLAYNSPMFTPFYQVMFQAATGNSSIKLVALASYKKPEYVKNRL